jgi:hypothetical protein
MTVAQNMAMGNVTAMLRVPHPMFREHLPAQSLGT